MNKERYARLRGLARDINRQRKVQARKIDILCNDMVQGHRGLLENLRRLAFTSVVHEALIACHDAEDVLKAVSRTFGSCFGSRCVALLLVEGNAVNVHSTAGGPLEAEASELPSFFTAENVRSICSGNHVCLLPELLELPVQIPPKMTRDLSVAAIPLNFAHRAIGVLLFFAGQADPIGEKLIRAATAAAPAVAKAITASGQTVSHS